MLEAHGTMRPHIAILRQHPFPDLLQERYKKMAGYHESFSHPNPGNKDPTIVV